MTVGKEPPPFGIPNQIGNTCWFQSCTQCLFRCPEIREKIISFNPTLLRIKHDEDALEAFRFLRNHFNDLVTCNPKISNADLVQALKNQKGDHLVTAQTAAGQDSYLALEAYSILFATLHGDAKFGFHSFNSAIGSLQSMKLNQGRSDQPFSLSTILYFILSDAKNNQTAMLAHLPDIFFLPHILVLRHDHATADMTHPDPIIELPEPFDYIASGKVLEKCTTSVKYELFAMVCYQGANSDHALALIKVADPKSWWVFNDHHVQEKGNDDCLKDERTLSTGFNWPALSFYRRLS
jgi:hypothetical protein